MTKKILFTGVDPSITEADVRAALAAVGPISRVAIVRDGDPQRPAVLVEMAISDEVAYRLTTRLTDYWHDGHLINARILVH